LYCNGAWVKYIFFVWSSSS